MPGVVHVPVFTSLKPSEYEFIQQNCGAKMVMVSNKKLFKCVSPALEDYIKEGRLYTFDEVEGERFWLEIVWRDLKDTLYRILKTDKDET